MQARKVKALRRRQLAALRQRQVETAEAFVQEWRELLVELPDGYECHLNCGEAEIAAALWRAFGDTEAAESLLQNHANKDVCGDDHHECTKECEWK